MFSAHGQNYDFQVDQVRSLAKLEASILYPFVYTFLFCLFVWCLLGQFPFDICTGDAFISPLGVISSHSRINYQRVHFTFGEHASSSVSGSALTLVRVKMFLLSATGGFIRVVPSGIYLIHIHSGQPKMNLFIYYTYYAIHICVPNS